MIAPGTASRQVGFKRAAPAKRQGNKARGVLTPAGWDRWAPAQASRLLAA